MAAKCGVISVVAFHQEMPTYQGTPALYFFVRGSGIIMSSNIADSQVMKEMDDNRGLMIIHDASHKHIQPLTLAYF